MEPPHAKTLYELKATLITYTRAITTAHLSKYGSTDYEVLYTIPSKNSQKKSYSALLHALKFNWISTVTLKFFSSYRVLGYGGAICERKQALSP